MGNTNFDAIKLNTPLTAAELGASAVETAKLADNNVTAAKLTATMRTGIVQIPITSLRLIAANAIPNIAANGGDLASDSAPSLARVNGATDKALRVVWAAASVVEVQAQFQLPPDLDDTAPMTVKMMARMAGATDTPTIAVGYFEGVGDADAGGATAALSAAIQTLSRTIASADVGAAPNFASLTLTPGAHGTDALWLYSLWVEYTRK